MIVIMCGLPGTGKTTLAHGLARHLDGAVLNKDEIRRALFPPERIEYSAGQDDFCQSVMQQTAQYLLAKEPDLHIFLDGRTFSRSYQRELAIRFAEQARVPWAILECVCPETTALDRIQRDCDTGNHPALNRTTELYLSIRDTFE